MIISYYKTIRKYPLHCLLDPWSEAWVPTLNLYSGIYLHSRVQDIQLKSAALTLHYVFHLHILQELTILNFGFNTCQRGCLSTPSVILMISGLNSKNLNSQLACAKRQIGQESLCIIQKRGCNLGAHSLDQACWHTLFGPHSFGPHSVFKTADLYAKKPTEKLLFLPFFEKIWQHWAHIPMWQQFAAVYLRWGRYISVFYGFITFYSNYFHWLH